MKFRSALTAPFAAAVCEPPERGSEESSVGKKGHT